MKRQTRTFSGFYFSLLAALLALSGILTVAWSQQPGSASTGTDNVPGNQVASSSANVNISDYNPTAAYDLRFHVQSVDFYRRYHPSGIGEFLDVVLDIRNNTNELMDLYAYVIAYDEDSAVDARTRNLVPYPTWRPHDPDKHIFLVNNVNISPVNVPDTDIWNKSDPDYQSYERIIGRMRSSVGTVKPVPFPYPPVWKYIAYLNKQPTKGVLFHLYGDQGPEPGQKVETNYIPQTPEERLKKTFPNLVKHTFTAEYLQRRTILRTHHFVHYKEGYHFFNRVVILLFDAKRAQGGASGSAETNPLIFKRTYSVNIKEVR